MFGFSSFAVFDSYPGHFRMKGNKAGRKFTQDVRKEHWACPKNSCLRDSQYAKDILENILKSTFMSLFRLF